jgi:hypothetical protein
MRCRQGRRAAGLLILCLLLPAGRASASYEEFSTLRVGHEEEDDENLLDHVLLRPPVEWQLEWRLATGGFRASEGCLTSGQWALDHELKVRVPMGDTTYMDLGIRDFQDDESVYEWTQFDLRFPVRHVGMAGLRFRPTFDKSRQDFALLWDHGDALSPLQIQAVFTLEDMFNKFWALRQTRVGAEAEPYIRRPYEPALALAWRGRQFEYTARGKWLSPSNKRFETSSPATQRRETLWGEKHEASLTHRFGLHTVELAYQQVQTSSFAYFEQIWGDHHIYQRRWMVEGGWSHAVGEAGRVAVRYFYQERTQVWRPPTANATLGVIDRMPMIEGWFRAPLDLGVRVGGMRNRVTVTDDGTPAFSWGTRVETRAFFALQRRFGRVWLQGTECIELDHERYEVSFHHDKGFLHIQTTF